MVRLAERIPNNRLPLECGTDGQDMMKFLNFDFWIMLGASLFLLPFVLRHQPIGRVAGGILVVAYTAYVLSQFLGISGVAAAQG